MHLKTTPLEAVGLFGLPLLPLQLQRAPIVAVYNQHTNPHSHQPSDRTQPLSHPVDRVNSANNRVVHTFPHDLHLGVVDVYTGRKFNAPLGE